MAGAAVFVAVRHVFEFWLSLALAIAATVVGATAQAIDFIRKVLETYKLWWDLKTGRREEAENARTVQPATADEIKEYGQSGVERILKDRYRKTGQFVLEPKRFIIDSREEKRP